MERLQKRGYLQKPFAFVVLRPKQKHFVGQKHTVYDVYHGLRGLQLGISCNHDLLTGTDHEVQGNQKLGMGRWTGGNLFGKSTDQLIGPFFQLDISCDPGKTQKVQCGHRITGRESTIIDLFGSGYKGLVIRPCKVKAS